MKPHTGTKDKQRHISDITHIKEEEEEYGEVFFR
jgi:hypothetical protein